MTKANINIYTLKTNCLNNFENNVLETLKQHCFFLIFAVVNVWFLIYYNDYYSYKTMTVIIGVNYLWKY